MGAVASEALPQPNTSEMHTPGPSQESQGTQNSADSKQKVASFRNRLRG